MTEHPLLNDPEEMYGPMTTFVFFFLEQYSLPLFLFTTGGRCCVDFGFSL